MLECPITIVGHPFSSVGMSEQMRSGGSARRSVGISPAVFDIYRYAARSDERHVKLVHGSEIDQIPEGGIRIFHLNGNEVDDAIDKIRNFGDFFKKGYNVIVPEWELPNYPSVWTKKFRNYNEVWAISHLVERGIRKKRKKTKYVGNRVE